MSYTISNYFLKQYSIIHDRELEQKAIANGLTANYNRITSILKNKSIDHEREFTSLYNQLTNHLSGECHKAGGLCVGYLTMFETYHDRYEYRGSNPIMVNAVLDYNERQSRKENDAENKKISSLVTYGEAIRKAGQIIDKINLILKNYPDIQEIIDYYLWKEQSEQRRKKQAELDRIQAEEAKKNIRKAALIIGIILLVILIFLSFCC